MSEKENGSAWCVSVVWWWGAFALLLSLVPSGARAATITAASCSNANVQIAINSAANGDTVTVPAGSCSWSSVSISDKKITLQGAGKTNTIITGMPSIGSSGSRVTGFSFLNSSNEIYGYGFRFDHNKVQSSTWTDCLKVRDWAPTISQMPSGLIDNNEFINCRINMEGTPYMYADDSGANQHRLWALPHDFGGQNSVYIENNTFELTYSGNFNFIDANYGGTFVARYNAIYDGGFLETHSSQEGGNRSGKSFEVYGNILNLRNNLSQAGGMSERWRGGTGFHFFNSYVGTWSNPGIMLDNVRSYATGSGCGLCNGASACDGNQNSSGWPCRDQIGRGPDNPRWISSPISAYTQPSVPTYLWGNRNGASSYPAVVIDWSSSHIQSNRDFYDYTSSFNGTSGVGCGTLASRPSTCTTGVGYWATNQSCTNLTGMVGPNPSTPIQGTLYKCTATNTWTSYYTPLAYPHPMVGTPDTEPPVLPANFNLAATSPSQSSITVSWNPATDNVGVTGYIVERCQGSGCSTFTQVGTPTASPFTDSGLTPNTFYNYHVRATDAAGNLSGWSNVVGATTQAPDTTPPTAPSNLQTSIVSSSNINLTWTASTDNIAVTGYKVERCTGASCTNFAQVGTPTSNSYSDTGLSATTLYRYRVRATDAANNNSSYSNISEGTTPVAPPTPTFIAEYETAWNSATSPKTTANFSVQTGDILVAYAVNESSSATIATPPTGTLTGTWTLRQTVSASNFTYLRLWTLAVSSNQTNVNVAFTNAGGNWGADVLHFRNASSVGVTAQANSNTGNPTLTLNGVNENSSIVMVNGDWSARTGARTYNTTSAGAFTETSAYADGSTYGVEAGYYGNAGSAGNKTIGLTAPTGMKWALAAVEVKGNPATGSVACNTVTTTNFSDAGYSAYGAPYDVFTSNTPLVNVTCTSADPTTINLTTGVTGDTTRIIYTKGYWYDPATTAWRQYAGTCTGVLNGEWCQGSVSATITDANVSTANAANPTYLVGMTCSVQGGAWKCGCRDTTCANFSWQIQGAGM